MIAELPTKDLFIIVFCIVNIVSLLGGVIIYKLTHAKKEDIDEEED